MIPKIQPCVIFIRFSQRSTGCHLLVDPSIKNVLAFTNHIKSCRAKPWTYTSLNKYKNALYSLCKLI